MPRAKHLVALLLVAALGACTDMPLEAPVHVAPLERTVTILDAGFVLPAPIAHAQSSGHAPFKQIIVDDLDPATETHTFDDMPADCGLNSVIPNPYEELTFSTAFLAPCDSPNGTVALVPSEGDKFGRITEFFIDLRAPASSAKLDVYDQWEDRDLTLNAYDGADVLVASVSDPTDFEWVTLSVNGDIHRLGVATDQANTFLDNLTITYADDEEGGYQPEDRDACKKGGWSAFGFRNQGQCVRFVETGRDSR